MADIVQQGRHYKGLYAADGDSNQAAVFSSLQQGA